MSEEDTKKTIPDIPEVPDEFRKIIQDFISDIVITFPEYEPIINRWWKIKDFKDVSDEEERKTQMEQDAEKRIKFIFKHCITVFPERFFDILYKNTSMFDEDSTMNTEFLPGLSFKYLWQLDMSDSTRDTIWKYLQLISISVVGCINHKDAFGDTAKLFDNLDENEFKHKLEETLENMQNMFKEEEDGTTKGPDMNNMPNANDIHNHINGMLSGKLGELAKEIAEETANDLNINMENVTDVKSAFSSMFKNPGKLMNIVKNVGSKLDGKIKSGEIKESELIAEASEIMNKMKNMPGMDNIQGMLNKMGFPGGMNMGGMNMGGMNMGGMNMGGGGKMNMNAMQAQLEKNMKMAQMKERMKKKSENNKNNQSEIKKNGTNEINGLTD